VIGATRERIMKVLDVKNVSWTRDGVSVLENMSFSVEGQRLVGVAGPNGAGKSSLFEVLMGWHRTRKGEIEWIGNPVLALLPQIPFRPMTLPLSVDAFVEMGTWSKTKKATPPLTMSEAFEVLGLEPLRNKLVGEISGGEWKRVSLARTLVQAADVFLLDEPFNYLDLGSEERVGHLLQDLVQTKDKTFLVISHDWHAMTHFFGRVILMNKKVLADGSPQTVAALHSDPKHHEWMHP